MAGTRAKAVLLPLLAWPVVVAAEPVVVGGAFPDRRPEDVPAITVFAKDFAWYAGMLHGIPPPFPDSLRFLDDQGAWYTPFDRPGAPGRYDLRGWHERADLRPRRLPE